MCFVALDHLLLYYYLFVTTSDLPQRIRYQPDVRVSGPAALVTWVSPGGIIDVYTVQYVLSEEGFISINVVNATVIGTHTSLRISGLQPLTSYLLRVAVQNEHGVSDFSPVVSFSTLQCKCSLITINLSRTCYKCVPLEVSA